MAEEEKQTPENGADQSQEKPKTPWQLQKESWYDKIPLTLKQLDWIVGICLTLLALTFLAIALDALGIFSIFG